MAVFNRGTTTLSPVYSTNYAAIEKIAAQKIYGAMGINDIFSWMDRGEIGNGTTLEEMLFALITGQDVNLATMNGANVDAPAYNGPAVRYYQEWTTRQYKTTISDEQIRKILLAGTSEEVANSRLAAIAVGQLSESSGNDDYQYSKGLYADAVAGGNCIALDSNSYGTTENDIKAVTLILKNAIKKMQFVNGDLSKAQIAYRVPKTRIHLIMPYQYANAIDVNWIAGVFNIDKAEIDSKLTVYDGAANGDNVYVCDELAYTKLVRLNRLTSRYIEDGLYQNYWLTTDKLYASSPLFKNAYVAVTY